ncbi:hypothetical protein Hesp01_39010 [Herbidospora sp. NBRC 101105]|nr:hypothetical protein Hesp01_39010 [Herbidospora sp. NBRC 101105]
MGAAADERQHPERLCVDPQGVVDAAQHRLPGRDLGQQHQRDQPDEEPVGGRPLLQPERHPQRLPLRRRQPVGPAQERRQQPVQRPERERRLLPHPRDTHRPQPGGPGNVVEQHRLPGAVGPEESGDLALPDGETDPVHAMDRPEPLGQ